MSTKADTMVEEPPPPDTLADALAKAEATLAAKTEVLGRVVERHNAAVGRVDAAKQRGAELADRAGGGEEIAEADIAKEALAVAVAEIEAGTHAGSVDAAQAAVNDAAVAKFKAELKVLDRTAQRGWTPVGEHEIALQEIADELWAQLQRTQAAINEQVLLHRDADFLRQQVFGPGFQSRPMNEHLGSLRALSRCLPDAILQALGADTIHVNMRDAGLSHITRAKAAG